MSCGAIIKFTNSSCDVKGKEKYNGRCGNHRDRKKKDNIKNLECFICGDECIKSVVRLKCDHFMCGYCWISNSIVGGSNSCPMCRSKMEVTLIIADIFKLSTHLVTTYGTCIKKLESQYKEQKYRVDTFRSMNDIYNVDDLLLSATVELDNTINCYDKAINMNIEISKIISMFI